MHHPLGGLRRQGRILRRRSIGQGKVGYCHWPGVSHAPRRAHGPKLPLALQRYGDSVERMRPHREVVVVEMGRRGRRHPKDDPGLPPCGEVWPPCGGGVDAQARPESDGHAEGQSHLELRRFHRGRGEKARGVSCFSQKIKVECQSLEEALIAAEAGTDVVMLDNFAPDRLRADAKAFKESYPHVKVEASGGITIETMADYFNEHV